MRRSKKYYSDLSFKDILEKIQDFCIGYFGFSIMCYILEFISKASDKLLFTWIGIIAKIIGLPSSQFDLIIISFGLHWIIFGFGFIFLVYKIYKLLKNEL